MESALNGDEAQYKKKLYIDTEIHGDKNKQAPAGNQTRDLSPEHSITSHLLTQLKEWIIKNFYAIKLALTDF